QQIVVELADDVFSAALDAVEGLPDDARLELVGVGAGERARPAEPERLDAPPDQRRTQGADDGFDFREFGHYSESRSFSTIARCSSLSLSGTVTMIRANRSPALSLPLAGMPLPGMRNLRPLDVPAGIVIFTEPTTSGTFT